MRPVTDLQRRVAPFEVITDMVPAGDQPGAIADMERRVRAGEKHTVLLGATGTGKTATIAWLAERLQRPTLVMLPNKTLAAQFANELREMLPKNAVEYFVSYYDYYQPEAYVPQTDTYIEKDSSINDEVERLRHSATNSLLTRRDTIVVASVSCIYGLGTPQEYVDRMVRLRVGGTIDRDQLLRKLVGMQYVRNDLSFTRGTFRVRGDTIEIIPVYEELAVRIEMFGDEIERLLTLHPLTGEVVTTDDELYVFPASHYVAGPERMERAIAGIETELAEPAGRAGAVRQAARGPAAAHAHHLRRGDAPPGRQLLGDRELLAAHRRPGAWLPAEHAAGLLPRGLPARHRRVARHRAADRRDVRGRRVPQAGAGRARLPAAERDRQPAADLGGVRRADRPDGLHVGHPRPVRAAARRRRGDRAGDPADRPGRPRGHHQADQGPDRRPGPRDRAAGRAGRAGPGHHADQEDGRGPHRLPAGRRHPGPVPAQRGGHAAPGRAAPRAAAGRVRRAGRHQPAARGPGPARGVAGGDPGRGQGGLPAVRARR